MSKFYPNTKEERFLLLSRNPEIKIAAAHVTHAGTVLRPKCLIKRFKDRVNSFSRKGRKRKSLRFDLFLSEID